MDNSSEENVKSTNEKGSAFDSILVHIGEFGSYQRRLFVLLCLPGMISAMHKLAWVFLGAYAEHRCLLPFEYLHNATFDLPEQVLNSSLPWNEARGAWARCERLLGNHEGVVGEPRVTACEHFVFDDSEYQSSAVFEFGLVCDWEWARGAANSALVIGGVTGALLFGNLSDRFGRRPIFLTALVLQVCAGVLASMAPSFWTFVLARFAIGATVPGVYITSCVIGMELVGPSRRQYATVTMQIFFSLGFILTAVFAYLIIEWRHLQLVITIPGLVCLAYWWLIPESPRWLMSQGRVHEAKVILQQADLINQNSAVNSSSKARDATLDDLLAKVTEKLEKDKILASHRATLIYMMMRFPRLRMRTLIVLLVWLVNGVSYFGLSWNTSDLAGNDYLNFSLSGLVEIPAHLLVLFVVTWRGRVVMQSGALLCAALTLGLTAVVPQNMPGTLTALAMLGKMASTASYGTAYVLSSETFPTSVRNAGMGACSTTAALGAIAASFIMLLNVIWHRLPFILLSALTLVAGLLVTRLPETLGRELPETLEDGENFNVELKKVKSMDKIFKIVI